MTNPRNRDLTNLNASASQPAKLPGLPEPPADDPKLKEWLSKIKEIIEVREGSRASKFDRVVTWRDLMDMGLAVGDFAGARIGFRPSTNLPDNGVLLNTGKGFASISVDAFADMIRNTQLYRDLMKKLDDPTRFDALPAIVRNILLVDIASEAAKRGADIQRIEKKIQDANMSFAAVVTEITAAIGHASAGVREAAFAYADTGSAVAGKVTQIKARLDSVDGNGVTIEELMYGSATNAGLLGQYTLKIQAGGALAGFGLSATDIDGTPDSAFIIAANKFAVVSPSYSGGLTNSPSSANIPFGVDGSGVYINGTVRINATGMPTLDSLVTDTGVYLSADTQFFKYDSTGSPINSSITLTANLTGGLTGYVDWDVTGGTYTGTLPSDGTANTATIAIADVSTDTLTIQITLVDGANTYTDSMTLVKLRDGSDALIAALTNESHTVPASNAGVVSDWTGAGGTMLVFRGSTQLTSGVSYSIPTGGNPSSLTASINSTSGVYSVTAAGSWASGSDTTTLTLRATIGSVTIDKIFTLTKSKQGATGSNGTNAVGFVVSAASLAFQVARDGTASPSSIAFSHYLQNASSTLRVRYTSSPSISGLNGVIYALASPPTLSYSSFASAVGTGNSATITATLYNPTGDNTEYTSGGSNFVENITVVRLYEGTHAITAILSNESHSFTSQYDGTVSDYTGSGTQIHVYEGTTELTYDGVGTSAGTWKTTTTPVNITVGTLTDSGTYLTVGQHSGFTAGQTSASITYTITGKDRLNNAFSITRTQTFSKGKQGATGTRGSLTGYASGSSWSDVTARDKIWTMLGNAGSAPNNSHLVIGDTVTISNGSNFAATKYWSGASWLAPGVVIDGNLLVSGTVSATALIAGTLTGFTINTATSGARITLNDTAGGNANQLVGINSSNTEVFRLNASTGAIVSAAGTSIMTLTASGATNYSFAGTAASTTYSVMGKNTSSGTGVYALNTTTGFGLTAESQGTTKAPVYIVPSASLPSDRTAGAVCFYNGWLCFASGTHWFQANGTQLT